jgi:hypothetical protein
MKPKLLATALIFLISAGFSHKAISSELCEHAFAELRKFEADNEDRLTKGAEESLKNALGTDYLCSSGSLEYLDWYWDYQQKLSRLAMTFVQTCKEDPARSREVGMYTFPAVTHPTQPTTRETCKLLRK